MPKNFRKLLYKLKEFEKPKEPTNFTICKSIYFFQKLKKRKELTKGQNQ